MSLNFRPATYADSLLIAQLADTIWREHYPAIITQQQIDFMLSSRYSEKTITEGMEKGENFYLGYLDNEPVAYASVEFMDGYYYLHKFYLQVNKHRSGLGTQLVNYLLTQIDATKPIRLQVNRLNYKAINFYFKAGFIIESVGDFDIGGGFYMNDFVMVRS